MLVVCAWEGSESTMRLLAMCLLTGEVGGWALNAATSHAQNNSCVNSSTQVAYTCHRSDHPLLPTLPNTSHSARHPAEAPSTHRVSLVPRGTCTCPGRLR